MIKGECRLIPVLIDNSDPPPELTGLLYADCRPESRGGKGKILRALEEAAKQYGKAPPTIESEDYFERTRGYEYLVDKVFGGHSFDELRAGARRLASWPYVWILGPNDQQTNIPYRIALQYSRSRDVKRHWDWTKWTHTELDLEIRHGLYLAESSLDPKLSAQLEEVSPYVFFKRIPRDGDTKAKAYCLVLIQPPITNREARKRITDARRELARSIEW
jgi:hypothetical protein